MKNTSKLYQLFISRLMNFPYHNPYFLILVKLLYHTYVNFLFVAHESNFS